MHDTLTPRLINMQAHLYDVTILGIDTHDPAEMRAGKADTLRRMSRRPTQHIEYQLRQRPDTRRVVDSLSDFCQTDRRYRETPADCTKSPNAATSPSSPRPVPRTGTARSSSPSADGGRKASAAS